MRRYSVLMMLALSLAAGTVQANSRHQPPPVSDNGVNTDVVVGGPAAGSLDLGATASAGLCQMLYF